MYKLLIFLKKTDEVKILDHFNNFILKSISSVAGAEVKSANVESNLLLEEKYSKFCELTAGSKEEMDKKMSSPEGKSLNKSLTDFHQFITVIPINYK
ncbi:MAG: hypothetical protein R6W90_13595 [Ignavibacteriaceae bacterium]